MKNLNLPTSFEAWNWSKDDDTIKAYYAINNKGYTAEFKAAVWNSLCNKLYQTLNAMSLSWDDKYTTYSGVLLSGYYPTLTAQIFNSVRHNIEVHVPTTWKWTFNKAYEGYVGRLDFRGASTTSNPDTFFGSYILEIARKLNLLISIFKNEASFAEPNVAFTFVLDTSQVEFVSLDSAILNVDLINNTVSNSALSYIEPIEFNVNSKNKHTNDALISLKNAAQTLAINERFRMSASASLLLEELYRNLYAYVYSNISQKAKLVVNNNKSILKIDLSVENINEATLILPDIINMLTEIISTTSQTAELRKLEPLALYVDVLNSIYESAKVEIARPRLIQSYSSAESATFGEMETITGRDLYSIVSAVLRIQRTTMSRALARRTVSNVPAKASINSSAHSKPAGILPEAEINHVYGITAASVAFEKLLMDSFIEHALSDEGSVVVKEARILPDERISSSLTIESSEAEIKLIRQAAHYFLHKLNIISEATANEPTVLHAAGHNELVVKGATLMGYLDDKMLSAIGSYFSGGQFNLDVLHYEGDVLITDYLSQLFADALINAISPFSVEIKHIENELFQAEPSLRLAEDSMHIVELAFQDSINASLVKVDFNSFSVNTLIEASIESVIEFDPSSWRNPVLINDVLEIYQVYEGEKEGMNLNLG